MSGLANTRNLGALFVNIWESTNADVAKKSNTAVEIARKNIGQNTNKIVGKSRMNCKNVILPIALLFIWACVVGCPPNQDSQPFQLPQSLLKIHESKSKPNTFDAELFRSTLRSEGEFWLKHKKILFLGEGSSEWTGKWAEQHMSFAEILKSE